MTPATPIHGGKPYGFALIPYLAFSLAVHALAIGGLYFGDQVDPARESGYNKRKFGRPGKTISEQIAAMEPAEKTRIRSYKLNYFHRIILPQPEVIEIAALPPELTPAPEIPKPKPKPKPKPTPVPVPIPDAVPTPPEALDDPLTSVQTGEIKGVDGEILVVPPFRMRTLHDDLIRTETDFLAYPAIFIVGDISTETGLQDMYTWVHFFHDILHIPTVVTPPFVLAIGESIEKPDFLPIDACEDVMRNEWEAKGYFSGHVWGDCAFDRNQEFIKGVGVTEVPVPQIYVIDLEGYVRIQISGRFDALNSEEVLDIAGEVRDQWGMNNWEYLGAKEMIFGWQKRLLAKELGMPTKTNEEAVPLAIPTFQPEVEL